MDNTEGSSGGSPPFDDPRALQVDNAIRAIQQKKPLPEIDFTIHTMEDGTQVNTQERICKGMCHLYNIQPAGVPGLPPRRHQTLRQTLGSNFMFPQMSKPPPC